MRPLRGSGSLPTLSIRRCGCAAAAGGTTAAAETLATACCYRQAPMARTDFRFAKLTWPRLYNAIARDRLFGKLDAVRRAHWANCVEGPSGAGKRASVASWLNAGSVLPSSRTKLAVAMPAGQFVPGRSCFGGAASPIDRRGRPGRRPCDLPLSTTAIKLTPVRNERR